jgi:3-isopropylmalate/(R)-2-methylmalate dehydratase large subunit
MPKQTIVEKIIQQHSSEVASPGRIVWMDLDVRTARDFAGANVVQNYIREYGATPLADVGKTFFTFDCVVPANNIPYANNQHICRQWAREQGVQVYDVNAGIGSHVAIEQGLALPGGTFVGTDSHLNILGAVGCFGQGMGDQDIAFAFRTGRTWFEVPATMKVIVKGALPERCTARDLTLAVLGKLGSSGALGRSVEFYGPAIESLSLASRITLCSQITEMGGIVGLIPPSAEVLTFCQERAGREVASLAADEGADYCQVVEIDISGLEPLISCPPSPANVKPVKDVAGTRIDSVFVGSCTNGRLEDFEDVARIVAGKRIAPWVMASAVPATREVFAQMLSSGVLQTLFDAGFIISNPGCGGCASGQIGMTGKGQVQISTSNRNFPGKQGAGETYLASPATAAWSALQGAISLAQ